MHQRLECNHTSSRRKQDEFLYKQGIKTKQNKTKLLVILKPNTINEKTDKFKYTIKIEQKTKYL